MGTSTAEMVLVPSPGILLFNVNQLTVDSNLFEVLVPSLGILLFNPLTDWGIVGDGKSSGPLSGDSFI